MAVICRRGTYGCVWEPDDDVVGHAARRQLTSNVTVTWSDGPDGDETVTFRADDPEVERALLDILQRAAPTA